MRDELIPVLIIVAILAIIGFFICDVAYSTPERDSGVIVDLSFSQGKTLTTNGVAFDSKGGVSPIVGTTTTSDEWVAMVKVDNGKITKVECKPEHYYGHKIGDRIEFKRLYGKWTGIHWGNFSVK